VEKSFENNYLQGKSYLIRYTYQITHGAYV
jgi:hypothetical protein